MGVGPTHGAYLLGCCDRAVSPLGTSVCWGWGRPCFCPPAQLSPRSPDRCIQLCPGTIPQAFPGPSNTAYLQLNSSLLPPHSLHTSTPPSPLPSVSFRSKWSHHSPAFQGLDPVACHPWSVLPPDQLVSPSSSLCVHRDSSRPCIIPHLNGNSPWLLSFSLLGLRHLSRSDHAQEVLTAPQII